MEVCRNVAEQMSSYNQPWGIAGGWAVDLFVGRKTRGHEDIEIAVFRDDQHILKNFLDGWTFEKVVSGELRPLGEEFLQLPIHEIQAVHERSGNRLEILLNEVENGQWIFRREQSISFPQQQLFKVTSEGIPYLHPAIVLLYKAKMSRQKDDADFFAVKDLLEKADRKFLQKSLEVHVPGHRWIGEL
ncbi:nucleotidyltransferase domain-containing protein [Sporosarcina sp. USHLN248]|uniref:nucleotidyltransferase domain-containing protein n=1 Tax=Sporosarcina sp. USHLN248 TaxID=3081300 RepID=UPI0030163ADB